MNKDKQFCLKGAYPKNCPFCQAKERGVSEGWGMSFEGWEEMKKTHIKYHCDKCPCCGQEIQLC